MQVHSTHSMDAFSSKPEDVLQRTVDVAVEKKRSLQDIENFLELDRCITFVTQNNFKKARM